MAKKTMESPMGKNWDGSKMRPSEAMMAGIERFPKNSIHSFGDGADKACAIGCMNWAYNGCTFSSNKVPSIFAGFSDEAAIPIMELSDAGVPREMIAGMLAGYGL